MDIPKGKEWQVVGVFLIFIIIGLVVYSALTDGYTSIGLLENLYVKGAQDVR